MQMRDAGGGDAATSLCSPAVWNLDRRHHFVEVAWTILWAALQCHPTGRSRKNERTTASGAAKPDLAETRNHRAPQERQKRCRDKYDVENELGIQLPDALHLDVTRLLAEKAMMIAR
jgi:hypothetical protein